MRNRLAWAVVVTAAKIARRLDPENVNVKITRKES